MLTIAQQAQAVANHDARAWMDWGRGPSTGWVKDGHVYDCEVKTGRIKLIARIDGPEEVGFETMDGDEFIEVPHRVRWTGDRT